MDLKDLSGIGTAATAVKDILGMFFPDKSEEERSKLAAVMTLMQGQMKINEVEAANPSKWVSGWRPYIGWICGTSLAMIYIPKAIAMTTMWIWQCVVILQAWNGQGTMPTIPLYPDLGISDLIGLLLSLLGLGGMRSVEKIKGAA